MTVMLSPHQALEHLHALRSKTGTMDTVGLPDEVIDRFCALDPKLVKAIHEASIRFQEIESEFGSDMLQHDEANLVKVLQHDFVNF